MILRLTCPGCSKDSFSASVDAFKPCPYCGLLFSGRHGTNRRSGFRMKREIPFVLSHGGQNHRASTMDISERGLSIKIFGNPSLPIGDILNIHVRDSSVKAQVIWVFINTENSTAVTGLKILDGRLNLP